jgi:hypothetical protein
MAGFEITQEKVEQWKSERARLERDQADIAQKLVALNDKIKAAALFLIDEDASLFPSSAAESRKPDLTAAVERIANEALSPVTKKYIRDQLVKQGIPKSRLGNYFYTVCNRLAEFKRITVLEDGRLWKAPK